MKYFREIQAGKRHETFYFILVLTLLGSMALDGDGSPLPGSKDKDWPQYRGCPAHDNFRKVKDKIRVPRVLWKIDRAQVPAAVGNDVYAGGKELRKVDLKTGKIKASWAPKKAGGEFAFKGTPVVLKDRVIAHASDDKVRAFSLDLSRVLWTAEVKGIGKGPFSGVCDGTAYVAAAGGCVVALEVQDGKTRWAFKIPRRAPVQMTPAIAQNMALFGSMNSTFYAVGMKTGQEIWSCKGTRAFAYTDPVVAFGRIFVGDRGGYINAIDLEKGTLVWSLKSGYKGLSTPGVFAGNILVGFSKFVATIKVKSGKFDQSKQGFRTDYNPFGSPTLVGRTLFFGNRDGHLYAFDYKRETLKWAFEVGEGEKVFDFIYHRDILLVSTSEGIYALGNNPKRRKLPHSFILTPGAEAATGPAVAGKDAYRNDIQYALKSLKRKCGRFFKLKNIDWKKVSKTFLDEVKRVKTDQDHLVLLVRLIARIRDGHAHVKPMAKGKKVKWPDDGKGPRTGTGMFWCRIGEKIHIKNAWSSAAGAGLRPGMEVLSVDGKPVLEWLQGRIEEISDTKSFSTDHQAFFAACHRGLSGEKGSRLRLEVRTFKGKKKKVNLTFSRASTVPVGPVFFPEGLEGTRDIQYGRTDAGFGYIHMRRCPGNLPELVDGALAEVGKVPGMILDFRCNGGGAFDHEALLGRFIPKGKSISFVKQYRSAGANPYGGPVVVIVDAGTCSAGETGSGMFKEDGRAYMIGETPTAGMSSRKTTIELPSGLFSLYVSVASNMRRFNKGRGIEGIGVIPHEIVEYDANDLKNGVDTLIRRAEELLKKFPQGKVPYKPAKFR